MATAKSYRTHYNNLSLNLNFDTVYHSLCPCLCKCCIYFDYSSPICGTSL